MSQALADWNANFSDNWIPGGADYGCTRSVVGYPSVNGQPAYWSATITTTDLRIYYHGMPGILGDMTVVGWDYPDTMGKRLVNCGSVVAVAEGSTLLLERIMDPNTVFPAVTVSFVHADWRPFLKYK
jgi:hypothetical protein